MEDSNQLKEDLLMQITDLSVEGEWEEMEDCHINHGEGADATKNSL